MKPRQSLRLNKRQERAYERIHRVLAAGPAPEPHPHRMARLWAALGLR